MNAGNKSAAMGRSLRIWNLFMMFWFRLNVGLLHYRHPYTNSTCSYFFPEKIRNFSNLIRKRGAEALFYWDSAIFTLQPKS